MDGNHAADPLILAAVLDSSPSPLSTDASNLGLLKKRPILKTLLTFEMENLLTYESKRGSLFSLILAMNSSVI